MNERFARSAALLGEEKMARLAAAHVLVVGVGGVGSWCAEALVRTGVGNLTLIDDDAVAESNLNRQAPATTITVGRRKVAAMAERLREINPSARIDARAVRYPAESGAGLWAIKPDLVIDAIDSVASKARLILDADAAGIPLLSSMGAALRTDPTRVKVSRFDRVEGDGLARALRQRFKDLARWPGKFRCVWSDEPPTGRAVSMKPPPATKGSIMPVTATFGMVLAAEAIRLLGERKGPARAVLSLGSNIEPRQEYLERAKDALGALPQTRLIAVSDTAETEPMDVPEAFQTMKFLNAVALVETELPVREFSDRMHAIEDALGRVRTVRNGPRTIDLDLIDFEGLRMNDPALTLPHPRANGRPFVTEPWKQIIRREMKRQRAAVPPEERRKKSEALCAKLLDLLGTANLVCCYEALRTELDLGPFVAACRERGVEVVFPVAAEVQGGLAPGKKTYTVARAGEVDLWICPGLAFTREGARIGFGGGWYDRFLAAAKSDARAFGVGYAFQLCPALPQFPHDHPLTGVVIV